MSERILTLGPMMDDDAVDFVNFVMKPTSTRPLLGLTILLLEDSRYCAEALRLLSIRSGARLRRADCLKSARRHLKTYRPDVVIVDHGLPDGSGFEIITELSKLGEEVPPVIAISGDMGAGVQEKANAAGAAKFVEKPFTDLAAFQQLVLSVLTDQEEAKGFTPRIVGSSVDPDAQALFEDLSLIHSKLETAVPAEDKKEMRYCAQLLCSVAQFASDTELRSAAEGLAERLDKGHAGQQKAGVVMQKVQERLLLAQAI